MKKNALLTFLFALIPGAGQMYYGYMQRGLSLISMFCVCLGLTFMLRIEALIVFCGIVWMYSFFDVYDLLRYAAAGQPKTDSLLLLGNMGDLKKYIPRHNKLLGWSLIVLGAYGVYALLLENMLYSLLRVIFGDLAWDILRNLPGVIVSVLFILAGFWLLGLRPPQKAAAPEPEMPAYPQGPVPPMPADLMGNIDLPTAPEPPAADVHQPEAAPAPQPEPQAEPEPPAAAKAPQPKESPAPALQPEPLEVPEPPAQA